MPPTKMGVEDEIGRYTPTANASDGMPDISSTTAIITPSSTSAHGSFAVEDAFDDVAHQHRLGRAELFDRASRRAAS